MEYSFQTGMNVMLNKCNISNNLMLSAHSSHSRYVQTHFNPLLPSVLVAVNIFREKCILSECKKKKKVLKG